VRTAVIIPSLNEEESIGRVISEVPADLSCEIIVVDNCSTDCTEEVARLAGARVVREERRGYGYACQAGVQAVGDEFDVVVFLDGDGSDDAGRMWDLVEPIEADQADLVLGSRTLGHGAHGALLPHQRLGNMLATALIHFLYHRRITDLPPFKAIRRSVLTQLGMCEMTYGWTVEMIVKCSRQGHRIVEVPVPARVRLGGQSKVSGTIRGTALAAYYLLGTALKYAWRG
jgi:glycosyltransferase involved in cell wall biosynthesis